MIENYSKSEIEQTPIFGKKLDDAQVFLEPVKRPNKLNAKDDLDFTQCFSKITTDDEVRIQINPQRINPALKNLIVSFEHALIKIVYAPSPSNTSKEHIGHAILRPGVEIFLDEAQKNFNVSIFTYLPLKVFKFLYKKLNLENNTCASYILKSDSPEQEARFLKDFDLSKTIFLHDETKMLRIPQESLLLIKNFSGSDADTALLEILPLLAYIAEKPKATPISLHQREFSKSFREQKHSKDTTFCLDTQNKSNMISSEPEEEELGIESLELTRINTNETSVASLKKRIFEDSLVKLSALDKENRAEIKKFEESPFKENKISPDSTPKSVIEINIKNIRAKLH